MNVGTLTVEMAANVARLERDMNRARTSVDGAMQRIQRSVQVAMRALGALGLGLGAAQLAGFVRGAINAGDEMQKMSQRIGVATESISGLQMAFRQGGVTSKEMEMGLARLSIGVTNQTEVFKRLGIQSKDTLGALMEVADVFQAMPDGIEKTTLSNELFSRSGNRLIPVLNQGADGLRRYLELAQRLGTSVTPELAKQFELYNDTLDNVGEAMRGIALQAAAALIPTLQAVASALQNAFESGSVQRGLEMMIEAVKVLGLLLGARLIGSIAAAAQGFIVKSAALATATAATTAYTIALRGMQGVMALMGGPIGLIAAAAGALIYFSQKAEEAEFGADALAGSLGLANGQLERLTQTQANAKILEVTARLAELEVQASAAAAELDNLNNTMSDPEAYMVQGAQASGELQKINKEIAIYQNLAKKLGDVASRSAEQQDVMLKGVVATANAGKDASNTIADLIAKYRQETDALIMSTDEKERAAFTQSLLNEGVKEGTKAYKEYLDLFDIARIERRTLESQMQSIEREKQANEARFQERIRQEEEFASEAQRINDQIGQSLTDAIMTGGKNAKDYLIDLFRTLVLRPILQPVISGVLGAIGVGATGAAMAGTGASSELAQATGLLGVVSAVKGAVDMVTGGFASVGAVAGNLTASLTSSALAVEGVTGSLAVNAALIESGTIGLSGAAMETATLTVSQFATAAASAATVLAGVGAGLAAGTLISGQFKVGGDQMISTGVGTAIGTGIGLAFGGPIGGAIGAAIGGAVGGLVNRAFGMGPKELFRSGVALDIGAGGLAETSFGFADTKQRGGLFRSDKEARQRFGVDGELADFFNQSAMAIANSVKGMTESFGLSTDEINNIQIHGVVETFGRTEEEITAQVDQILFDLQESLIRGLIPNIDAFANATDTSVGGVLQRLSASLTVVNSTFDVLGFSLYDLTLAGGDAASKMIELVGGIEAFTAATSFYYENFYSAEERANKQLEQMTELFTTMGMVLPDSRDAFRALVESAEAAGNQALVASLLQIAPAFISMKNAIEELPKTLVDVEEAATKSAEALREQFNLETRLLQLQGDTVALRARELDSLDESNRGLLERIYLLEDERAAQEQMLALLQVAYSNAVLDTDQAFSRLQVSLRKSLETSLENARSDLDKTLALIQTQRQAAGVARDLASESITAIKSVFDLLTNEINDLGSSVLATQTSAQARLFITQALQTAQMTGYLPASADLGRAIGQARGGMGSEQFASAFEQQRDQLRLRNELIQLQEISGEQLTEAERQLMVAENTLASLDTQAETAQSFYDQTIAQAQRLHDKQLQYAQSQIDVLRGIDNGILSVADAINALAAAINSELIAGTSITQSTSGREAAITELYNKVLERAPDEEGLKYWVDSTNSIAEATKYIVDSTENRVQDITRMYEDILSRAPDPAGLNYWVSSGGSLQDIQQAIAASEEASSLRGFANGGYASMGMAMVGERGPELVDFNRPAQVYTNNELRSAMGGSDSSEIRALREENRAQSRAMVSMQSRMTRVIEQWNNDGLPQDRYEGATA
jgi:hypothetical protein